MLAMTRTLNMRFPDIGAVRMAGGTARARSGGWVLPGAGIAVDVAYLDALA
jgi:hypothetical protein